MKTESGNGTKVRNKWPALLGMELGGSPFRGLRGCSQFFNFDAPRNNLRVMTKKVVTRRVAHLSGIGIRIEGV